MTKYFYTKVATFVQEREDAQKLMKRENAVDYTPRTSKHVNLMSFPKYPSIKGSEHYRRE